MITWNYVKDGMPEKSGRYLFSSGSPDRGEGGVNLLYYNKQRKKIYTIDGRDEDGNPTEFIGSSLIYAWAEVPKAAAYVEDR